MSNTVREKNEFSYKVNVFSARCIAIQEAVKVGKNLAEIKDIADMFQRYIVTGYWNAK